MTESAAALTSNGFLPAGMLRVPESSRENLDRLAEGSASRHSGAANMHRIALVSGDVQWMGLSIPADDLRFVQQRELSTREIARIFGVPVWMIGGSSGDSMTYSNAETQALTFAVHSLRP
jgi:HK97 family phage portal protein